MGGRARRLPRTCLVCKRDATGPRYVVQDDRTHVAVGYVCLRHTVRQVIAAGLSIDLVPFE